MRRWKIRKKDFDKRVKHFQIFLLVDTTADMVVQTTGDVFTDLCQHSGPLSHSSAGLLVALLCLVDITGLLPALCSLKHHYATTVFS